MHSVNNLNHKRHRAVLAGEMVSSLHTKGKKCQGRLWRSGNKWSDSGTQNIVQCFECCEVSQGTLADQRERERTKEKELQ